MSNYTLKYPGNKIDTFLDDINNLSGIIVMWSGAIDSIPNGWVLCDGNNNTPDLRNRFIVGAGDEYNVNNIGGSANVTLTTAQIPSHLHSAEYSTGSTLSGDSSTKTFVTSISQNSGSRSFSTTTAGSGESHENRPPYYALAYIMKI